MIKYWGGDKYDLFGFDLGVGDEMSCSVEVDIPDTPNSASYSL